MKLARFIVKYRYIFLGLFAALAVASVFFIGKTKVNYDLKKYLPDDSDTNVSLGILESEGFGYNCMMNVMLKGESVNSAQAIAATLETRLNDGAESPRVSLVTISFDESGEYALLQIAVNGDEFSENADYVAEKVPELLDGEDFAVSGGIVQNRELTDAINRELPIILGVSVAVVLVILLATSSSWTDPLLFLIVVGVAALLNMGTNFIFGSVSYITQSVAVVLQLALAMDYSIILLHNYNAKTDEGLDAEEALTRALSESFASVFSSCLTTVAGLSAVIHVLFHRFRHRHGAVKGRFNQYDNGFSAYARADSAVQKADCQNAPQAAYAPDQTLVGFFLFAAKGHFPCIGRRDSGLRGAQHRLQYLQLQSKSRFRRAGGAGD